jgi:putative membrane protein
MMGWGYGMGAAGWLVMTGLWLMLLLAAVAAVMWIFPRESRRTSGGQPPTRGPQETLAERLARGDIDIETYRRLRDELTRTTEPRR